MVMVLQLDRVHMVKECLLKVRIHTDKDRILMANLCITNSLMYNSKVSSHMVHIRKIILLIKDTNSHIIKLRQFIHKQAISKAINNQCLFW